MPTATPEAVTLVDLPAKRLGLPPSPGRSASPPVWTGDAETSAEADEFVSKHEHLNDRRGAGKERADDRPSEWSV